MSLMSSLRDFFAPPTPAQVIYFNAPAARAWVDGLSVEELYETQPQLRTVISFIAANIAQLPLKCYRRESDLVRTRDTTGIVPTLLRFPNRDMTTYDLIYTLVSDLKLYDIALWLVAEDADSPSGWVIRPIPPAWVAGYEEGDLFSADIIMVTNPSTGATFRLRRDEVIVWHGWRPGHPRDGVSPVTALKALMKDQIEMMSYRSQMWDRAARVPAYITRPITAEPWDDADMDRFATSWREAWSRHGSSAGGTPVLEDGMEIKASPSMAMADAQWEQTIRLSLTSTCALYRIKPGLISDDGQTYASVRENARSLYAECLGPDLRMIAERLTCFLLPMVGAPEDEYVEFDLDEKLNGSFVDRAEVLSRSVGAPWMTRAEARAISNLPPVEGADQLIVPMNVAVGGLASPADTTAASYAAASATPGSKGDEAHAKADGFYDASARYRLEVEEEDKRAMREVLVRFFARQEASVMSALGAAKAKAAGDDEVAPGWWNEARWDRELGDDLYAAFMALVDKYGASVIKALGESEDAWSSEATEAYVRATADAKAHGINRSTLRMLVKSIDGDYSEGAEKSTPAGVFEEARNWRAEMLATSLATLIASWATMEGVRQSGRGDGVMKQWVVTSGNPRDTHAAMNGEIAPYDGRFSNGARWPGDTGALDVDEVAGCTCVVELIIP